MSDDNLHERVAANAAAARVPIDDATAERVARAVGPAVQRLAAADVKLAMEVEPATFVAAQRRDAAR
jgi:hypothetical protein